MALDCSLVQMATGAGKTYTAVTEAYRLLKHGGFARILFLVDRNNLADQTLAEFQNYRTPDGRRFTDIQAALASAKAGSQQLSGRCCRRPSRADSPAGRWTRSRNR